MIVTGRTEMTDAAIRPPQSTRFAPLKKHDSRRQRAQLIGRNQNVAEHELVPHIDERIQTGRNQTGNRNRKNDADQRLCFGAAVDLGGFLQVDRYRVKKAAHHKGAERNDERGVCQHQRNVRLQHMHLLHDHIQRYQKNERPVSSATASS